MVEMRPRISRGLWRIVAAALLLAGCAQTPPQRTATGTAPSVSQAAAPVCPAPGAAPVCAPCNCEKPPVEQPPPKPGWKPAEFSQLPDWASDNHAEAWRAFMASCKSLRRRAEWQGVCADADRASPAQARAFFESRLTPWIRDAAPGIVTGYYEPLLNGSRTRKGPYNYAAYAAPDDLLTIDLGDLRPDLKGQRLRGRLDGKKVVPYYSREQIEGGTGGLATSKPILYVDDAVELFFLMIQGSGRIRLDNGEMVHLNYADQNGYPYRSVGRYLIDQGEMKLEQASMQGIKAWALANPARLNELLNHNPSYIFFRETRATADGPDGALGVPLTAQRSIAVDPKFTPLGAPVWLVTTRPNSTEPLRRLMLAQDTGGAITGANRADFFWGFGDEATREAGRMRQNGELYVLWPKAAGEPPK